jgi:sugar-specific transcriptional regulator TrmB
MDDVDDAIIRQLRAVGLAQYEARVYVALLRHGAQNGNELSRSSGVPSSKVYATLEKLTLDGLVQSTRQGSQVKFMPISSDELLSRLRRRYNDPLDFLEEALPRITAFQAPEPVLTVTGLPSILSAVQAIIEAAHRELHISCWVDDLPALREALDAAVGRGVSVFGMLYGEPAEPPGGSWLHHSYEDIVAGRIGGRMLTLVVDDAEALIARIPDTGEASAVRTRSSVLTLVVEEYLHHDFVLQRAQINIGFDEWDRWWQADPDLRTVILGRLTAQSHPA